MRNREFMAGIVVGAAATSIFWWLSRKARGRNAERGDHAGDMVRHDTRATVTTLQTPPR